jgi:hypothetical protein
MDPFQYQQQQQLQYQQQYGQQQVQFVPAYPFNVQAQTNQHGAPSSQYGGTFTAFSQQPMNAMVGMYPSVVPETQFSQNQGQPQGFTPTAYTSQSHINQTFQSPFGGAYHFQQQQPATNLPSNTAIDTANLPATSSSSTSFVPPPMNYPTMSMAGSGSVQPSVDDINQKYSEQYQKWQQQYNEWQAQHANHPDKKLFLEYQQQVQQWQQQQQQQMLQVQGVTFSQQSQTPSHTSLQNQSTISQQLNPQVTPSKTMQQPGHAQSQTTQALPVNLTSHISHQTQNQSYMYQQLPAMQYQSSTNLSNQASKLNTNQYYNSTQNFPNTQKHQDGNTQQYGKISDNKKMDYGQQRQSQQYQLHNQKGKQNPKTIAPSDHTLQGISMGRPKSDVSKENSTQGGFRTDAIKPLPKWMQSQENKRQENNKTTQVKPSTSRWVQGEAKSTPPEKGGSKQIPKWLQDLNNEKLVQEQQGYHGQANKQLQNKKGNEPVKEQLQQKTIKETKPIPKWLVETKTNSMQSSTKQSIVTKQAERYCTCMVVMWNLCTIFASCLSILLIISMVGNISLD